MGYEDTDILQSATSDDYLLLTESEAKELTESIKSTTVALSVLLHRAHEKKAWKSLGYNSWKEYIEIEFEFTRARSYQLLDQGRIIEELSDASDSDLYLTEKEAKIIKKELPKITQKMEDVADIDDDDERLLAARKLIEDEIKEAMASDENRYSGEDIDDMIEEDKGHVGTPPKDEEENPFGSPEETSYTADEDANFYLSNLNQTLSIIEAFPRPKELSTIINASEEEQIKLKNKVLYAIKWLNSLDNEL